MKLWAHRRGERRAERRENSFPSPSHNHWTTKIKRLFFVVFFSFLLPARPQVSRRWGAVEVRAGGQRGRWVGGTRVMRCATQGRGRKARVERRSVGSQKNPVTPDCFTLHPRLDPAHPTPRVLRGFMHGWPVHHGRPILWQVVGSGILDLKDRCHLCCPVVSGRRRVLRWWDKHTSDRHACICMYSRQFANL